ncbi:TPA: DNA pacase A subunit [Enterobacter kobei]
MSGISWDEHRERFAAQRADTGITIKEYSEQNGLSFNTARKHLNLKKNSAMNADQAGDHLGDHSGKTVKKTRHPRANNKQNTANNNSKITKTDKLAGDKSFRAPPKKRTSDSKLQSNKNNRIDNGRAGSFDANDPQMIPEKVAKKGIKKTAKATKGQMIPLLGSNVVALPSSEATKKMLEQGPEHHLRLVIEMANESALRYRAAVDQEAARLQEEIDDIQPGDEIEGVHPSIKLRGLLEDSAYFMNDFTSRLAAIYQGESKLQQGAEKLRQAARQQQFKEAEAQEKLGLAREQMEMKRRDLEHRIGADARAARVIATALRMREREELDDIGVAEYIERQGVSVPAMLAAQALRAIAAIEPPVADNTVDEEQLEKDAQAYHQQQREHPEWLANRRAEVAKVVEELGCGDIDATGDRKAGEFDAGDEDLDLDPSATSDIYDVPNDAYDNEEEIAIDPPEEV